VSNGNRRELEANDDASGRAVGKLVWAKRGLSVPWLSVFELAHSLLVVLAARQHTGNKKVVA
jgi:hypothetical protein